MNKYIQINEKDNVAVALENLPAGFIYNIQGVALAEPILQGHKFALVNIAKGKNIIKYGNPIGIATADIKAGYHIHSHNMATCLQDEISYEYEPALCSTEKTENDASEAYFTSNIKSTFKGYHRPNGNTGIRNDIWIIPTVGCVNDIAKRVAEEAKVRFKKRDDMDFIAFPHPYGCSQLGDDQENTRKILADLCMHPNAGGVLLLGLGCENSSVEEVTKYINDIDKLNIKTLISQDVEDEIESSLNLIDELTTSAMEINRQALPISDLIIGVKCGGSDGLSGITANPLVGKFTDELIQKGGSVIMTEVPEMFGAEHLLMNRCKDEETFHNMVSMIQSFKDYFVAHNQPVYENPSPGNKDGGITTLEEKSLGCTQKSGSAAVSDILDYGELKKVSGLSLLYGPGNDLVASTALAASGAQIVLFTTGRGTPFACPVPTVKISSNTDLSAKKRNWIDFDAGILVSKSSDCSITNLSAELFKYVIEIAEGKKVKSEESGFHDMAIFKQSITL